MPRLPDKRPFPKRNDHLASMQGLDANSLRTALLCINQSCASVRQNDLTSLKNAVRAGIDKAFLSFGAGYANKT